MYVMLNGFLKMHVVKTFTAALLITWLWFNINAIYHKIPNNYIYHLRLKMQLLENIFLYDV